jgi:hypothetical protein
MEEKYGVAFRQWWSPEIRLKDMDRLGWDIQDSSTGNNGNFAYRVALKDSSLAPPKPGLQQLGSGILRVDPKRLKFVAILPGSDIGEIPRSER